MMVQDGAALWLYNGSTSWRKVKFARPHLDPLSFACVGRVRRVQGALTGHSSYVNWLPLSLMNWKPFHLMVWKPPSLVNWRPLSQVDWQPPPL